MTEYETEVARATRREFVRLIGQIAEHGDDALFNAALVPVLADASFADVAGTDPPRPPLRDGGISKK